MTLTNLPPRRTDIVGIALIAFSVIAVYGKAVDYGFMWDDNLFLVGNDAIKNLANIPSFFGQSTVELYRPLRTTLYAVCYALFGLNSAPYHAMGLCFHILATLLAFRILALVGFSHNAALFGAMVFALHPVHIEKTIFITSIFDIPGDLCLLTAVYCYLSHRRGCMRHGLHLSIAFYAVGLLFAETAATFPLIWILMELVLTEPDPLDRRKRIIYFITLCAVTAIYLVVRTSVIGRVSRPPGEMPYLPVLVTMGAVFLHYWRLLMVPYPLVPGVPPLEVVTDPFTWYCHAGIILNIVLLVTAWNLRKSAPLITLAVFWFYLSISPNSNIIPTGTLMAERYLYLPSVGFSMLCAYWFAAVSTKLKRPVVAGFLVYFAALSAVQTANWQSGETIWLWTIKQRPHKGYGYHNLGAHFYKSGEFLKAVAVYKEMLRQGLDPVVARSELGAYAIDRGDYLVAESLLRPIVRVAPRREGVKGNLLVARCNLDRPGWREEAQQLLPELGKAVFYEQVANCYLKKDDHANALALLEAARERFPRNAKVQKKIDYLRKGQ